MQQVKFFWTDTGDGRSAGKYPPSPPAIPNKATVKYRMKPYRHFVLLPSIISKLPCFFIIFFFFAKSWATASLMQNSTVHTTGFPHTQFPYFHKAYQRVSTKKNFLVRLDTYRRAVFTKMWGGASIG